MTEPFKRTTFTAGQVMWIKRNYMSSSPDVMDLTWEEAAQLYDWLTVELEKRS